GWIPVLFPPGGRSSLLRRGPADRQSGPGLERGFHPGRRAEAVRHALHTPSAAVAASMARLQGSDIVGRYGLGSDYLQTRAVGLDRGRDGVRPAHGAAGSSADPALGGPAN